MKYFYKRGNKIKWFELKIWCKLVVGVLIGWTIIMAIIIVLV